MALAKKCDVCGKLYEHYSKNYEELNSGLDVNGIDFVHIYEGDRGASNSHIRFDLCPECMKAITTLIGFMKDSPSSEVDKVVDYIKHYNDEENHSGCDEEGSENNECRTVN